MSIQPFLKHIKGFEFYRLYLDYDFKKDLTMKVSEMNDGQLFLYDDEIYILVKVSEQNQIFCYPILNGGTRLEVHIDNEYPIIEGFGIVE